MRIALAAIGGMVLVASSAASAQTYFFRERLREVGRSIEATSPETTPPTSSQASWDVGEWSPWSSTCSDAAVRTRPVTCLDADRQPLADGMCTGSRPDASEGPKIEVSNCSGLIVDGSFESGTGWLGTGEIIKSYYRTGQRSMYLNSNGGSKLVSQNISTIPGVTYTVSFWAQVSNSTYSNVGVIDVATNKSIASKSVSSSGGVWTRNSFTWKATQKVARIYFSLTISGGGYVFMIDDVELSATK